MSMSCYQVHGPVELTLEGVGLTGLGCWVLRDGEGFRPCLGVALAEGAADDACRVLPCSAQPSAPLATCLAVCTPCA